jgi:Secretion system C-terminal sorting domain
MKYLYLILILFLKNLTFAQNNDAKRDYEWLYGYKYKDISFNLVDFKKKPSTVTAIKTDKTEGTSELNAQICDKDGKLLLYTLGCDIRNSSHNIVQGSDSIGYGTYWNLFCPGSYSSSRMLQSMIILPNPKKENQYAIFQAERSNEMKAHAKGLLLHEVDMSLNNGDGKVITKNKPVYSGMTHYGGLLANRHANGKDWWLMIPERTDAEENSPYYLSFLYTGDSLYAPVRHTAGNFLKSNLPWENDEAAFSPDGTKYARIRTKDALYLYDFDRNTGIMSNMRTIKFKDKNRTGSGVAFSPNSKYLYASSDSVLYQIDTEVNNLEDALITVGEYDKYIVNGFFATTFYYSRLAPDCKVYIVTAGSTEFVHVVNYPNRKGAACGLEQRAIKMPTKISRGLPNYPHFRLGKLDEPFSPCDSTINPYIKGDFTSVENIVPQPITVAVYPNPTQNDLNIDLFGFVRQYKSGRFDLYNPQGQLVQSFPLQPEHDEYRLDISDLTEGIYIWQVVLDGNIRQTGKVVKME